MNSLSCSLQGVGTISVNSTNNNSFDGSSPIIIDKVTDIRECYIPCDQNTNQNLTTFLCGRSEPVFPQIVLDSAGSCADSTFFAVSEGTEIFNAYTDSLKKGFDSLYRAKCLNAYKYECFTVKHVQSEYRYTLYYYDQAGNLVKTVPPAGVHANYDSLWMDSVKTAVSLNQVKVPSHTLMFPISNLQLIS